jgi:hypothetical protein
MAEITLKLEAIPFSSYPFRPGRITLYHGSTETIELRSATKPSNAKLRLRRMREGASAMCYVVAGVCRAR